MPKQARAGVAPLPVLGWEFNSHPSWKNETLSPQSPPKNANWPVAIAQYHLIETRMKTSERLGFLSFFIFRKLLLRNPIGTILLDAVVFKECETVTIKVI